MSSAGNGSSGDGTNGNPPRPKSGRKLKPKFDTKFVMPQQPPQQSLATYVIPSISSSTVHKTKVLAVYHS